MKNKKITKNIKHILDDINKKIKKHARGKIPVFIDGKLTYLTKSELKDFKIL